MNNRLTLILAPVLFLPGATSLQAVPNREAAPLLTPAAATRSVSQRPGRGRNPDGFRQVPESGRWLAYRALRIPYVQQELGLTQGQIESLRELEFDTRGREIELQGALRSKRLELQRLLTDASPERSRIDQLIDELSRINADRQRSRINARLTVRELLSEDQIQRLSDLLRDRQSRLRDRRPHGNLRR